MKKWLFLLFSLIFCLSLSACGSRDNISGKVVEVTPTALILETNEGKQIAVLLEENTYIWSMDGIDGNDYKAAPHLGVQVSFYPDGRAASISTSAGKKVKTYRAPSSIHIDAYFVSKAAILSDGTVLDAWKTRSFGTLYQTKDGIELLREYPPKVPENYYTAYGRSFDGLSETATTKVTDFYEKQGKLYDLQAELERAWDSYKTDLETFSPFTVSQETFPVVSSEQIFYFRTEVTQILNGNNGHTTYICDAFDRETGEKILLADLFAFPEEEIGKKLLDLAAKNGSCPSDGVTKEEMEAAFRMEYLFFSPNSLELIFPQGTLPSQELSFWVSVSFSDECKALLYPWAIPHHNTQ